MLGACLSPASHLASGAHALVCVPARVHAWMTWVAHMSIISPDWLCAAAAAAAAGGDDAATTSAVLTSAGGGCGNASTNADDAGGGGVVSISTGMQPGPSVSELGALLHVSPDIMRALQGQLQQGHGQLQGAQAAAAAAAAIRIHAAVAGPSGDAIPWAAAAAAGRMLAAEEEDDPWVSAAARRQYLIQLKAAEAKAGNTILHQGSAVQWQQLAPTSLLENVVWAVLEPPSCSTVRMQMPADGGTCMEGDVSCVHEEDWGATQRPRMQQDWEDAACDGDGMHAATLPDLHAAVTKVGAVQTGNTHP